ncbi:heat shock protein 70 [Fistulina hepatica ATCC 64428]|uniref:Heat shock protein 70 n=1 Tax=Fistulina hepatica ATCC 64428 TaxID=1128425 RepID=A0A0D7AP34_9AGAR|nr:heat shock protein 70 [Fistulina hepatica ATCC 64428]
MAVVGFDLGTLHSKIGVARHRGIDIITNEVSNRATPSLVAFGPKQRVIGESAKTQETSNFKNTVGSLKRLIGHKFSDGDVQAIEQKFMSAELVDVNGQVGANVKFLGEPAQFSATQLVAMYLGKLRDTAGAELKNNVTDVVISVPVWFTDSQRRAVLDAAAIANLNVLRLINEPTAVALGYGITKSDLPDPADESLRPRHIVFVDVGHSSLSCAVVAYVKGQLTVLSTAWDRHLGGRDIDYVLVNHFAEEFKGKYKIDVLSNPKARFRLAAGCEKLKKVLSANAEAPLSVENIMNDVDASSRLSREELEALIAPMLDRIVKPLKQAVEESGLPLEEIDAIELVGGCTRVPAVKRKIEEAFPGKTLSMTLNQDEAVARGATLACAMLSPVFRVREFTTRDINNYAIKLGWEKVPEDEDSEIVVFDSRNAIPSTKILTFFRKEPFGVEASYAEPSLLPGTMSPWVANFSAKSLPETKNADDQVTATTVKVKTRLNPNGIFSFDGAYVEYVEEQVPMEVDGAADAPAPPKKKKTKKEIPFIFGTSSLDKSVVEALKEKEAQMYAADKLVIDTEDRKNALEEYVYDTRGKLDDRYAAFVQPSEKSALLAKLQEAENWLYTEEGEDATKSAYVNRLDDLKVLGDPIVFRYTQYEERSRAISQLRDTLTSYMNQATSTEERLAHIAPEEKQKVIEKVANTQKWLEDMIAKQAELPKYVDPKLTTAEIGKQRDEVIYFATPILTKPKPKVPSTTASGTQTPDPNAQKTEEPKTEEPKPEASTEETSQGPSEMDVD